MRLSYKYLHKQLPVVQHLHCLSSILLPYRCQGLCALICVVLNYVVPTNLNILPRIVLRYNQGRLGVEK